MEKEKCYHPAREKSKSTPSYGWCVSCGDWVSMTKNYETNDGHISLETKEVEQNKII